MFNVMDYIKSAVRVMTVITKPKMHEFKQIAKITCAGMIFIGVIGYIISYIAVALS